MEDLSVGKLKCFLTFQMLKKSRRSLRQRELRGAWIQSCESSTHRTSKICGTNEEYPTDAVSGLPISPLQKPALEMDLSLCFEM